MTKEQTIQRAYSKETWSIIGRYVDEDGWLHTDYLQYPVSIKEPEYQEFDTPPGYSCDTWVRPKSLRGIETNNGWIKIESVKNIDDLPKYYVWLSNGIDIWTGCLFIHMSDKRINTTATHYQPVIKPKPPLC